MELVIRQSDFMGHRANFVIIRDNAAGVYYDQWAALGCIYGFAVGPTEAVNALAGMEETNELMDWALAEGGYLLDFDRKVAICFGEPFDESESADEESVFAQGPLAFLEHIAPAWRGWKLVWDERGVDAFAAYLKARNINSIRTQAESHPPETAPPVSFQA
jgi:hypothetical protein